MLQVVRVVHLSRGFVVNPESRFLLDSGLRHCVVLSAEEYARLKRRDRRVGLTEELPEEWVEAVRNAKVPDEFAALDAELKWLARAAARARSGSCRPL